MVRLTAPLSLASAATVGPLLAAMGDRHLLVWAQQTAPVLTPRLRPIVLAMSALRIPHSRPFFTEELLLALSNRHGILPGLALPLRVRQEPLASAQMAHASSLRQVGHDRQIFTLDGEPLPPCMPSLVHRRRPVLHRHQSTYQPTCPPA